MITALEIKKAFLTDCTSSSISFSACAPSAAVSRAPAFRFITSFISLFRCVTGFNFSSSLFLRLSSTRRLYSLIRLLVLLFSGSLLLSSCNRSFSCGSSVLLGFRSRLQLLLLVVASRLVVDAFSLLRNDVLSNSNDGKNPVLWKRLRRGFSQIPKKKKLSAFQINSVEFKSEGPDPFQKRTMRNKNP